MLGILIAVASLIGLVFFLVRYKQEGIVAVYLAGLPVIYLITDWIGFNIPQEGTGAWLAVTSAIAFLCYFFRKPPDAAEGPARRFTLPVLLLVVLTLTWYVFHIFERVAATIIMERAEYFKWAYAITNWIMAMMVGFFFPLNATRVRRLLRAVAILGITMCIIVFIGYFAGRGDLATSYGKRYMASEKLGGGNYSIMAAMAAGALLGGYLVAQEKLTARRIVFVVIALMLFMGASVLGGSRSPIVVMGLITLFAMGTFRFRYVPIGLAMGVIALAIVVLVIVPMLPEGGFKRAMTYESMVNGITVRLWLVYESFNILNVSPVWGQTIGLEQIIGMAYSHNFTLQMMVETGLVGFALYLASTALVGINWVKMLVGYQRTLFAIGAPLLIYFSAVWLEAHAHGDIMNRPLWFCLAVMAAHPPTSEALLPLMEYEDLELRYEP